MKKNASKFSFYISSGLHFVLLLAIFVIPPSKTVSERDYKQWVGKFSEKRIATLVSVEPMVIQKEKPKPVKKVKKSPKKPKPTQKKRVKVVKKTPKQKKIVVNNSGLLALIGAPDEKKGDMADVFGSTSAVNSDINDALKKSVRVKVAEATRRFETKRERFEEVQRIGKIRVQSSEAVELEDTRGEAELVGQVELDGLEFTKAEVDEAGVRGVLRRRSRSFQQCYESALKGRALEGKITLIWSINGNGKVMGIKVADDRLNSNAVLDCVKDILTRTRFPKPKNGRLAKLKNTFVFQTAG